MYNVLRLQSVDTESSRRADGSRRRGATEEAGEAARVPRLTDLLSAHLKKVRRGEREVVRVHRVLRLGRPPSHCVDEVGRDAAAHEEDMSPRGAAEVDVECVRPLHPCLDEVRAQSLHGPNSVEGQGGARVGAVGAATLKDAKDRPPARGRVFGPALFPLGVLVEVVEEGSLQAEGLERVTAPWGRNGHAQGHLGREVDCVLVRLVEELLPHDAAVAKGHIAETGMPT